MKNFIEHISIQNYKSIQSARIEKCGRVNVFIGKPNVGKSNILEAIGLLGLPFIEYNRRKLNGFVKCENYSQLFYNGDRNDVLIDSNIGSCRIFYESELEINKRADTPLPWYFLFFELSINDEVQSRYSIDEKKLSANEALDFVIKGEPILPVKKYSFHSDFDFKKGKVHFLLPPFGKNLGQILSNFPDLVDELKLIFKEYNLSLLFDTGTNTFRIIKNQKYSDTLFSLPFQSMADTLQRIIFYKTAIKSNKDSILIFEEPEAHAFPPYIKSLTEEIIADESNQYFIATHSPFVFNTLLANKNLDLAVYVISYDDKTKVKRLTDFELGELYKYGTDVFFNIETL